VRYVHEDSDSYKDFYNIFTGYKGWDFLFLPYGNCLLINAIVIAVAFFIEFLFGVAQNAARLKDFFRYGLVLSIMTIIFLSFFFVFLLTIDYFINLLFQQIDKYISHTIKNIFDWMNFGHISKLDLSKGFSFSFVSSIICSISFLYYLTRSGRSKGLIFFRFLLLAFILGVGLFISLFSLTNFVYNIYSFSDFNLWYQEESKIGLIIIRVSSFVVFYGLIKYVFNHVFNKAMVFDSGFRIIKYEIKQFQIGTISYNSLSSIYFSQMGFYIMALCILFYSFRVDHHSISVSLLNWALFFIIDDWAIIYNYTYRIGATIGFDKIKIGFFNLILMFLSITSLLELGKGWFIVTYIIILLFLFEMWWNNTQRIKTI